MILIYIYIYIYIYWKAHVARELVHGGIYPNRLQNIDPTMKLMTPNT